MENGLNETIERMVSFALGSHVDLRGSDIEAIVGGLESAFSSSTCQFIFRFRPSGSITTGEIETMIQDLYMQGLEVVMVVQDYIKRIKPMERSDMRYLELGEVVNDFSTIAKRYNIPVVTAMQLNRDAYLRFEAALKSGKPDAVMELGASNVGESIMVYENADVVVFQGRVFSEALGGAFLTVRQAKFRGKRKEGSIMYFAQPFATDPNGDVNEMKLVEDAMPGMPCQGRESIGDGIRAGYDPNADTAARAQDSGVVRRAPDSALNAAPPGGRRKASRPVSQQPPAGLGDL